MEQVFEDIFHYYDIEYEKQHRLKHRIENNDTIGFFLRGPSTFKERCEEEYGSRDDIEPRIETVVYYGDVVDYQIMNDRNFINANFVI